MKVHRRGSFATEPLCIETFIKQVVHEHSLSVLSRGRAGTVHPFTPLMVAGSAGQLYGAAPTTGKNSGHVPAVHLQFPPDLSTTIVLLVTNISVSGNRPENFPGRWAAVAI